MLYCCYCGRQLVWPLIPTAEHLVPRSHGGNNSPANKWRCCEDCNTWRGNKTLPVWKVEIEGLMAEHRTHPPFTRHDLEIMLENIDYTLTYIISAGEKLKNGKK